MDTDDISKPERFEKQIRVFNENPQIDVVGSWIDEFDDTLDEIISTRRLPETHEELKKYSIKRSPLNHPVVMFKKIKVLECGGYELYGLFDDWLLWMKMIKNGSAFYNIQESLLFFRASGMHKRRGGLKYAIDECKLQWLFYKRDMITIVIAISNIFVRFIVRVVPNQLRIFIYKKALR
jgi:hypothetical protein